MPLYRSFHTQQALDAEYDVDTVTPAFPRHVQALLARSAEARATLPHQAGVPYGPTVDETLDIFPAQVPAGVVPPVLVFFHGGYWRLLTAQEFNFVALGLARSGITTVIPTYSLCPHVSMDEIVRQARAAVAWTARNAASLGADPARLFVGGHSAGAQLAVMTLLTDWAGRYGLPADVVRGVIPISGLYDLRPLPFTCIGPSLQLDAGQVLRNSPMLLELPAAAPPLLLSYGGGETAEFQRQSADFLARWLAAGLPAERFAQPGRDHFAAMLDLADPGSGLTRACARFCGADPR
ncbi:MAG: alpha/beta hydrolase [Gemmatimonadetes bacterium]|nr:alpha/beta hydrolase [Gemmatimonadota bacterium]